MRASKMKEGRNKGFDLGRGERRGEVTNRRKEMTQTADTPLSNSHALGTSKLKQIT